MYIFSNLLIATIFIINHSFLLLDSNFHGSFINIWSETYNKTCLKNYCRHIKKVLYKLNKIVNYSALYTMSNTVCIKMLVIILRIFY